MFKLSPELSIVKLTENRFTRPIKRWFVRFLASRGWRRSILNKYYNTLGATGRSRFHNRYYGIFRNGRKALDGGVWHIRFADRDILLPLRSDWAWQDWETAISIIGHDSEIKQTYSAILNSSHRPNLFLDIGANYGTHSVLFLAAGIPTFSFEPNPNCFSYFETVCKLNQLAFRWEPVAIGDVTGRIELVYPEKHTWFGTVSPTLGINLKKSYQSITTQLVPLKKLDDYFSEVARQNILIKIDVEGHECACLRGASRLITHCSPMIIFESFTETRNELFGVFKQFGYHIYLLPWEPSSRVLPLPIEEFTESRESNFIAIPYDAKQ
jgi:FkbM family methyltransferase